MPAYPIAEHIITDAEKLEEYRITTGNELLWPSVNVAGHQESVPMFRRHSVEFVFDGHLYFVATTQANDRSMDGR